MIRKYTLTVGISPRGADRMVASGSQIEAETEYNVMVELNPAYKLKNWVVNGDVVPVSLTCRHGHLRVTMPPILLGVSTSRNCTAMHLPNVLILGRSPFWLRCRLSA